MASLAEPLEQCYRVFARHGKGSGDFCLHCYDLEEIAYLARTPPREVDDEQACKLLHETADHWMSSEVYRHYLPRMLEVLATGVCDDLYPEHLFETLNALSFASWPDEEKEAVRAFVTARERALAEADPDSAATWREAAAGLRVRPLILP